MIRHILSLLFIFLTAPTSIMCCSEREILRRYKGIESYHSSNLQPFTLKKQTAHNEEPEIKSSQRNASNLLLVQEAVAPTKDVGMQIFSSCFIFSRTIISMICCGEICETDASENKHRILSNPSSQPTAETRRIRSSEEIYTELVQQLLSKHRTLEHLTDTSPLVDSGIFRFPHLVKKLLEKGASVEVTDPMYGWKPVHLAILYDSIDCLKLFLNAGANPNCYSSGGKYGKTGRTPLCIAVSLGKSEMINTLKAYGVSRDIIPM